jgi:hypothetical protein
LAPKAEFELLSRRFWVGEEGGQGRRRRWSQEVLCKGKRKKENKGNTKVKTGSCFPLDGQTLLCLDLRV